MSMTEGVRTVGMTNLSECENLRPALERANTLPPQAFFVISPFC